MTTIDFNSLMEEAGEGFQPIPPGPYTVEVSKTESVTSGTGKPMIRAQLRVIGGPHNGRILFDQYTITAGNPNALGFFFDTMAALGLPRDYFKANPPMEQVAQALLGRQCNVTVAMKQYQGIDRNDVKNYRPLQGGAPPAAAPIAGVPQMGGAAPMAPQTGVPQMPQAQQTTEQFLGQFGPQGQPQPQQPAPQQPAPQQPAPQQPAPQQPAPVAPQEQQGQPQQQMWQPSAPPPGIGAEAPQQQPQQPQQPPVAPPEGAAPPIPQVPDQNRSI